MTIAIICQNKDPTPWRKALLSIAPDLDIRVWPELGDKSEISFALTWQHPPGCFADLPNLMTISSMGAGVDQLLADKQIPENCQIVRLVDSGLVEGMADYLQAIISSYRHHLGFYKQQQEQFAWSPRKSLSKSQFVIGVMGLGQLGRYTAQTFYDLGYPVRGWSKSSKSISGVKCFYGDSQLTPFLKQTHCLINLLPLTELTRGIINQELIETLPRGASLVNVGRGQHVNELDLIKALQNGQLAAAILDAFDQEPLTRDHDYWKIENLLITPHVSSLTDPMSVAPQIIGNYKRTLNKEELLNKVDRELGY